jgi:hypothetical protein
MCQAYNALPRAGGVLDQDDLTMRLMIHARNVSGMFDLQGKLDSDGAPVLSGNDYKYIGLISQ